MRVLKLMMGAMAVMTAVSAATSAPAQAGVPQYRRLADVSLETYVTRTPDGPFMHMAPPTPGESQEWVVSRGYATLITMVITYPSGQCWSVDPDGGEGTPLRLVECVAGQRAQEWRTTAYPDGVMFRSLHVDHNHRCAGFLPDEPELVLRELTCDEDSPTQRFSFQPYED